MTPATELREKWEKDAAARKEWRAFKSGKTWAAVRLLVETEAIEAALSFRNSTDGDPVLARNLARLQGATGIIRALDVACDDPPPPPNPEDDQAFSDAYVAKIMERKQQNR